jgi:hypothetical protein
LENIDLIRHSKKSGLSTVNNPYLSVEDMGNKKVTIISEKNED